MEVAPVRDPGPIPPELDRRQHAMVGEAPRQVSIVLLVSRKKRADFILVGEDDVDAPAELGEEPIARGVHDLEGGQIEADRAAGGPGRGQHRLRQRAVEHEVALDVGVTTFAKIRRGEIRRGQGHGGAEARALQHALGECADLAIRRVEHPRLKRPPSTPSASKRRR